MPLKNLPIPDFTAKLGSNAPTPGGGGAAALSGAQGAALSAMVCALTEGKKKYAEYQDFVIKTKKELDDIAESFLNLIDEDANEFQKVAAVFSMPKDTDADKAKRDEAMENSLKACTKPPYKIMELALQTLKITKGLIGKTYMGAVSDIGVAALCLKTAAKSGYLNVLININSMKDKALSEEYREKAGAMLEEAEKLADELYEYVLISL